MAQVGRTVEEALARALADPGGRDVRALHRDVLARARYAFAGLSG